VHIQPGTTSMNYFHGSSLSGLRRGKLFSGRISFGCSPSPMAATIRCTSRPPGRTPMRARRHHWSNDLAPGAFRDYATPTRAHFHPSLWPARSCGTPIILKLHPSRSAAKPGPASSALWPTPNAADVVKHWTKPPAVRIVKWSGLC